MQETKFSIVDTETTGRNPFVHEVIEIGVVICDRQTLAEIERFEIKAKPEHLELAEAEALQVNGYNEKEWQTAIPLGEALALFIEKVKGTKPAGWNVTFDREFLNFASWKIRGKPLDELPYSWFEIKSVAEEKLFYKKTWDRFSLTTVAEDLGISRPQAHRALADAETAWRVLRALRGLE